MTDIHKNPFLSFLGIDLYHWEESRAEFRLTPDSTHLNRRNVLQGGVIATLLDAACGYSGLYVPDDSPPLHSSTLSLSINYLTPGSDSALHAVGVRKGGGRNIYFAEGYLRCSSGNLIATAQGVFKYHGTQCSSPNR